MEFYQYVATNRALYGFENLSTQIKNYKLQIQRPNFYYKYILAQRYKT